jgi:hypothetical protein
MPIKGGCCCGAVRYEVDGSLRNARCCHCAECRKAFSGASSAYAEVDTDSFAWTLGEHNVTHYRSPEGWGLGFCCTCGLMLCGLYNGKVHGVTLGTSMGIRGFGSPCTSLSVRRRLGAKLAVMLLSMQNGHWNQVPLGNNTAQPNIEDAAPVGVIARYSSQPGRHPGHRN